MKIIRIALTSLEPYFLGNDKNLKYVGADMRRAKAANYYSVSEKVPSQSTLFGVLRYLGLSEKHNDYSISEEAKQNIGGQSFLLLKENQDGFGRISHISNLYLMHKGQGEKADVDFYVRMPLDHVVLDMETNEEPKQYHPFPKESFQKIAAGQGERWLPTGYPVKNGFAEGYVNLKDSTYVKDEAVFDEVSTIGIQVDKEADGYFRRVRYQLKKDYAFCFFAEVADDFYLSDVKLVYLGYGKSAFAVKTHVLEEGEKLPNYNLLTKEAIIPGSTKRVALSDTYVKGSLEELYGCCTYVHTQSREYREFSTNYGKCSQQGRFQRGTSYIRLIKAGSVFYVNNKDIEKFVNIVTDKNAEIAGFNQMTGGGEE